MSKKKRQNSDNELDQEFGLDEDMASESMNVLLRLYGGVLAFVGIRNEALGTGANHHTPLFDVDEQAMIPGAAAAAAFALEALTCEKLPSFARKIVSLEDLTSRKI